MEQRNIQFMLDTNILIDLNKYLKSSTQYAMVTNPKHFCEIKALANLLDEDLNKGRDREINFSVPERVLNELLSGFSSYGGEVFHMLRRFDIATMADMEKNGKIFRLIYTLLRGSNIYYPQFQKDLFEEENNDCIIITSSIMKNIPVLTSNIKHFAGENNIIENDILDRLDTCSQNSYVKKNFDLKFDNYRAYSISGFLKEYYPEKYDDFVKDLKNMRNVGGRD